MSPWWLRPTAEGADDERDAESADAQKSRQQPADQKTAKSEEEGSSGRGRKGSGGSGGGRGRSSRGGGDRERQQRSRSRRDRDDRKDDRSGSGNGGGGGKGSGGGGRGRSRSDAKDAGGKTGNGKGDGGDRGWQRDDYTFDEDISFREIAEIREEILSPPERNQPVSDERKIALFCDLENIALGVRDSNIKKFDINLVMERLLEKGKIIVKKAYCDWERYSEYKRPFHEAAIEMIDIPQKYYSGKNSADIKLVVDALDLSYSKEHLDTFVVMSGDSDFSPLVSKLKENNKYVIGIGVKDSSSNLLIDNCDEFMYYEDLWRDRQRAPKVESKDKKKSEAFRLMVDAIQALLRDNKDVLWGSMIKQTMQRKKPSFNEGYYGYSTFSELLEDAQRSDLIKLKKDSRSGTYIVTGFSGKEV